MPDAHLRALRNGHFPDGLLCLGAGSRSVKTFDFLQFAVWTAPKNSLPLKEEDRDCSYKIALAFRDLVLVSAYYPDRYVYGINQNYYVQLWAENRRVIYINQSPDERPPKSAAPGIETLLQNIWAVSETWLTIVENVAYTKLVV